MLILLDMDFKTTEINSFKKINDNVENFIRKPQSIKKESIRNSLT